jgi:hypothetical protein
MKICIIKLGNMVEGAIELVTFGRGKDIATWIAHKLGFKSCGCDERKAFLNKIMGCSPSPIKLDFDDNSTTTGRSELVDRKKSGHPFSY